MSPTQQYTNARVLISKSPENTAPSKSHFRTEIITITTPELKENELFVKTLVISLDPCMLYSNSFLWYLFLFLFLNRIALTTKVGKCTMCSLYLQK